MVRRRIMMGGMILSLLLAVAGAPRQAEAKKRPPKKKPPIGRIDGSVLTGGQLVKVKVAGPGRLAVIPKTGLFGFRGANLKGRRKLIFFVPPPKKAAIAADMGESAGFVAGRTGKKPPPKKVYRVFSTFVTVPPGGKVALNNVKLDSTTGKVSFDEQDITFNGVLASVDCSATPNTLVVTYGSGSTATITFDPTTTQMYNQATNTQITTCADLSALSGSPVEVEARINSDGSYFAKQVTVNPASSDSGDSNTEVKGTIASTNCPNSIVVTPSSGANVTININSGTQIQQEDSDTQLSCADLSAGEFVDVEGVLQSDGSVTANQIQVQPNTFESDGTINSTSCSASPPSISFTPTGGSSALTVTISSATAIHVNDNDSATCADLTAGAGSVEGVTQSDGSVAATKIEQSTGGDN